MSGNPEDRFSHDATRIILQDMTGVGARIMVVTLDHHMNGTTQGVSSSPSL